MNAKITVLAANYNTPVKYLKKAIDSVLSQTLTDFEFIIVNDGSTDESVKVLYDYAQKDSRIRIVENGENRGLAASLNHGLDECRTRYVARFDTDDICLPDRLEKQLKFMEENPGTVVCGGRAKTIAEDEDVITDEWKPEIISTEDYRIRLMFGSAPLLVHPAVCLDLGILNKNGLRYDVNPDYRYTEDLRFWHILSDFGDIKICPEFLIKYRNFDSPERITVRHREGMEKCSLNTLRTAYKRLEMDISDEDLRFLNHLLQVRKPYKKEQIKLLKKIKKENDKRGVFSKKLMGKYCSYAIYKTCYYSAASESGIINKIKILLSLPVRDIFRAVLKRKPTL